MTMPAFQISGASGVYHMLESGDKNSQSGLIVEFFLTSEDCFGDQALTAQYPNEILKCK
jgi:hypothetical protein